jgi:hypothetical protein
VYDDDDDDDVDVEICRISTLMWADTRREVGTGLTGAGGDSTT